MLRGVIFSLFFSLAFNAWSQEDVRSSCESQLSQAQEMVEKYGADLSESLFQVFSLRALNSCLELSARTDQAIHAMGTQGRIICDLKAAEGFGPLYVGYCYLQLAETVEWMITPEEP